MTVVEILRDMINRQKRLDIAMYGSNNATYNQDYMKLKFFLKEKHLL